MFFLYKQELFKLLKRRSTKYCLIFLVLQNIAMALGNNFYPKYLNSKEFFASNFASLSFISFIMIAASASIIATEFEYNTIKDIFYQPFSRKQVLISKWLTIFTYSLGAYLLVMVLSLINYFILFSRTYSLSVQIPEVSLPLWQYWLVSSFASFITLWLLLSVVLLIASGLKRGSTAIVTGIVGSFVLNIIGSVMLLFIHKWDILKWNPFNFLYYPQQVTHTGIIIKLTHLNNSEMLIGSLFYMTLFLLVGMYLFSRKEV